jgi:CBS domain-containing protein
MSLENELKTERVSHLDLSGYSAIESGTPMTAVLDKLRADHRHVALVIGGGRLIGILTDRDIMRKVAPHPNALKSSVDVIMSRDPITVHPNTSAAEALRLMTEHHFRNLPVVDERGAIKGVMTHQAIIDFLSARYPEEVLNRPMSPDRFPRRAEGG